MSNIKTYVFRNVIIVVLTFMLSSCFYDFRVASPIQGFKLNSTLIGTWVKGNTKIEISKLSQKEYGVVVLTDGKEILSGRAYDVMISRQKLMQVYDQNTPKYDVISYDLQNGKLTLKRLVEPAKNPEELIKIIESLKGKFSDLGTFTNISGSTSSNAANNSSGCIEKTVYVNKAVDSGIPVSAGDKIYFTASGLVTYTAPGLFGNTDYSGGPEGMDFCLAESEGEDEDGYDFTYCSYTGGYFNTEPFGRLLVKVDNLSPFIKWDDDAVGVWEHSTKYIEFTTIRNGFLLFNLNNQDKRDIKGFITVKAKVCNPDK